MPAWLLKTEPETYAYADLVQEGCGRWDGVKNALAQRHLRAIAPGDDLAIYHTGKTKAVVGLAAAVGYPYPDPGAPPYLAIDVAPRQWLPQPVPLAQLKVDPVFADCALIRLPRLSVVPLTPVHWAQLLRCGELR
ncbi:MAG TPA: EVE domain-containing protein [Cyanobacteria bacterium UBA8156]|jgi:predicted RNA-binding protein with PUA-like domain|nr:EVE domain-containing protein [Cyanobacteria bacterium UBA8156]